MVAEHEEATAFGGERGERRHRRREALDRAVDHVAGEGDQIRREGACFLDRALNVGLADASAHVQIGNLRDAKALEIGMQARHAKHNFLDARPAQRRERADRHREQRGRDDRGAAVLHYGLVRRAERQRGREEERQVARERADEEEADPRHREIARLVHRLVKPCFFAVALPSPIEHRHDPDERERNRECAVLPRLRAETSRDVDV